jgi:8-oxo-dGTP diphosphatase
MNKRFNIRVYGLWINENRILVNEELIKGQTIIKFPGGGLIWGEGIADCLKREWKEELDLDIELLEHFYTTDFFQPSAFDDSQVISIYYRIAANVPDKLINLVAGEQTYWMNTNVVNADTFTLPIDKKVGHMIESFIQSGKI